MEKPQFTFAHLLAHQEKTSFQSHLIPTSAELLARYRREYAAKRALFDALFTAINEDAAQLTVQTSVAKTKLVLPQDLLEAALQPVLDRLERDLSVREKWILEQAAQVEAGTNECGLVASDEQWAVSTALAQPLTVTLIPAPDAPQAA